MLQLTNDTFRENKDNQIDMYSSKYGEANYFVAYLKKIINKKTIQKKIWIYQYPQTTIDILKHMPMRTWPYIS